MRGRRFGCEYADEWERIESNMTTGYVDPAVDEIPEPVFVTAFDEVYRTRGERLVANIREKGYKQKIIAYAMGDVTEDGLKTLRKACNVEIRYFNFSKYPNSVRKHKGYRFKSLVLAEVLSEYKNAVWFDTSVIFRYSNISQIRDFIDCRKKPTSLTGCHSSFVLTIPAGHGTFPVTHKDVYDYIPTNLNEIKKNWQYGSGFMYAVRTKQTVDFMKWFVLCALDEGCMSPKGSRLFCNFGKDTLVDGCVLS